MKVTMVEVLFEVEHSDDVTDDELHDAISKLEGSIIRATQDLVQDKHWIAGFLATSPEGLLKFTPDEVWVKG